MLASRIFFGFASADFSGSAATAIVVAAAKKPLNTDTIATIRARDMGLDLSRGKDWKPRKRQAAQVFPRRAAIVDRHDQGRQDRTK